mmetsp:Transcript_118891/g.341511  ORF Transcript_118891/g.341511 Transcript_118891/m.341511 type:complete len:305 (-) Transcript_118891:1309-2223(-)
MAYCPQTAQSLRTKLSAMAMMMPPPKPMLGMLRPCPAMMMPAVMYTGMPGTGGSMNMARPIQKKIKMTHAKGMLSSNSSFSHARKITVTLATPTDRVQYKSTSQFARTKMITHRQPMKYSNADRASGVRSARIAVFRRRNRTCCLTNSTTNKKGNKTPGPSKKQARNQSFVTTNTSCCMTLDFLMVSATAFAFTSMQAQAKSAIKAEPQKPMMTPVNRMDAPAMEVATHIHNATTVSIKVNCVRVFSTCVTLLLSCDTVLLMKQNALMARLATAMTKGATHNKNKIVLTWAHAPERSFNSSADN